MKRLILTGALLMASLAEPANAAAVDGNIGVLYKPLNPEVYGVEAELGPNASPWSVGFVSMMERYETTTGDPTGGHTWVGPVTSTAWGRFEWDLPSGDSVGALAGVNFHPDTMYINRPVTFDWQYVGPLVGASYTFKSGRLWIRLTPHYVFSPNLPSETFSWILKSGIPWAEIGVRLHPSVQLSFRLSEAFLKLAWTFD